MYRKIYFFIFAVLTGCTGIQVNVDFNPGVIGKFNHKEYSRIIIAKENSVSGPDSVLLQSTEKYLRNELFKCTIYNDNKRNPDKKSITDYARKTRSHAIVLLKNRAADKSGNIEALDIEIFDPYGPVLAEAIYRSKTPQKPEVVIYRIFNDLFFEDQSHRERQGNDHNINILND